MKTCCKQRWIILGVAIILLGISGGGIYKNVPLRTQIYRSIFKGNWNMTCDGDTVYATGYCGIRKYLVEKGEAVLLAENETFLRHRIVGHGCAIMGNHLFLACRSYLAGPYQNDKADYEGELVVLDKTNLKVVSEFSLSSKMNDAELSDSILVLSGINRFYLFDVSQPAFPVKLHEHISSVYKEYQGCATWKESGRRFVAFTLFTQGIDIWDITDTSSPRFVKNIALSDICTGNKYIHSLDIKYQKPNLYATLAPMPQKYFQNEDVRGVVQINVTDMDSIVSKAYTIPREDYWKPMPGDSHPKSIAIFDNKIYLSAATSGAAVFNMSGDSLVYKELLEISSSWNQIYPIVVTNSGYLVSGDWNWNKIHVKQISKNGTK